METYLEATFSYPAGAVRLSRWTAGGRRLNLRYAGAETPVASDLPPRPSLGRRQEAPGSADAADHGRFLAGLERTGQAVHAGPAHRLDEVPTADPIGMASFPCGPDELPALLRDDPALISVPLCDILPWHVADV